MFTVYIRIAIEAFMFTVLMILSEIKYYIKNGGDQNFGHGGTGKHQEPRGNYVSFSISCILLILPFLFLVLVFISWKKNKEVMRIDEKCKSRELYKGILQVNLQCLHQQAHDTEGDNTQVSEMASNFPDNVKIARLYHFRFLTRRLIMTFIVVLFPDSLSSYKISILLVLQTTYLVYSILNRSFDERKDQMVEVFNESVFLILIMLLIQYHSESDWTDTAENAYIGIILSQLWILTIVSIVTGIVKLIKLIRRCRKSNPEEAESKSLSREVDVYADASFSMNDGLTRNKRAVPRGSEVFNVRAEIYEIRNEEEKDSHKL